MFSRNDLTEMRLLGYIDGHEFAEMYAEAEDDNLGEWVELPMEFIR